jgi:multidrug efflux pump subunit AcrA (membrane-fusion protein)
MYTEGMTIGSLDTGNTSSNEKVATIKTEGMPVISVNLSEIDVSRVEVGQKVTVTVDSIQNKTFTGSVVGVNRIGQTSSGVTQYPSIVRLDTAPIELLPGMAVTASIVTNRKDGVITVPSNAVTTQNGESVVRIQANGKEQTVPVTVGIASDTETEIISGVSEGDQVITGTLTNQTQTGNESPFSTNRGFNMMRMR